MNTIDSFYNDVIPEQLKAMKIWGVWRLVQKEGEEKPTKIPINPLTKNGASSSDSSTWVDFNTAVTAYEFGEYSGLAMFVTDPIVFIDIDDVREEIDLYLNGSQDNNVVADFLNNTDSYTELSQSGNGLHIIAVGKKTTERKKRHPVEIYDGKRFVALTGDVFDERYSLNEIPKSSMEYLEEKYLGKSEKIEDIDLSSLKLGTSASTDVIVERLKNNIAFSLLFSGKLDEYWQKFPPKNPAGEYPYYSEADYRLCVLLAKETNCDIQKMQEIFTMSKLVRDKTFSKRGEDKTYLDLTIEKAIQSVITSNIMKSKINSLNETEAEEAIRTRYPEAFNKDPYSAFSRMSKKFTDDNDEPNIHKIESIFFRRLAEYTNKDRNLMKEIYKKTKFKQKSEEELDQYVNIAVSQVRSVIVKSGVKNYGNHVNGLAERFMDSDFMRFSRYSPKKKGWLYFDGKKWVDNVKEEYADMVRYWVKRSLKDMSFQRLENDARTESEILKLEEEFGKFYNKVQDPTYVNKTLESLSFEKDYIISSKMLDVDNFVLNTQNGILNLSKNNSENFELQPHEPETYLSKIISTSYDPEAKCPKWEQFLKEIFLDDDELIRYVQRCVGYSLTGDTSEQVMFVLLGKGGNGKGVFLNVLKELMGKEQYANTMQIDSITKKTNTGAGHSEDLARLEGARFVVTAEPSAGVKLDEGLVKQLTGGDTVTASYKGGSAFEYKPKFKIWLMANYMPRITGTDDGIWRRLPIIPFERSFKEEEKDKHLEKKLLEELPGILNWAIEGCFEWQYLGGLNPPEKVKRKTMEQRMDSDPIGRFLLEKCNLTGDLNDRVKANELLNAYNDWAFKNSETEYKHKGFTEKIQHHDAIHKKRFNDGVYYVGLTLKD